MEALIADWLKGGGLLFHQEVEFGMCINPKTGYRLRFDFYLPDHNILIEYDGISYHKGRDVKYRDGVKTTFASENGIRLIRLQGQKAIEAMFSEFFPTCKKIKACRQQSKPKKKKAYYKNKPVSKKSKLSKPPRILTAAEIKTIQQEFLKGGSRLKLSTKFKVSVEVIVSHTRNLSSTK
jgi:hypothetical protein